MLPQPHPHRRRPRRGNSKLSDASGIIRRPVSGGGSGTPNNMSNMSPMSAPLPPIKIDSSLTDNCNCTNDSDRYSLLHKSTNKRRAPSFRRTNSNNGSTNNNNHHHRHHHHHHTTSAFQSCWENSGLNFLVPALTIWSMIVTIYWWPELKDNALDYYYLQYPEQQPLSPIPGTVLPLIPNVWMYDPDNNNNNNHDHGDNMFDETRTNQKTKQTDRQQQVQNHLREHKQPHYYMLPQDYYDQQPPSDTTIHYNNTSSNDSANSNTALEAPRIRGILIVLHNCHQSGLHFFQLPESRIVAARALQRGLAIFSPTSSTASALLTAPTTTTTKQGGSQQTTNNKKQQQQQRNDNNNNNDSSPDKNCWSTSLDGDELLGPLLYEWVREMNLKSLPRMAIGVSNGANLLISSSLYKTLRLQSMALYASHHKDGFDVADLDRDVIPATAFVVFPHNTKATEHALKNYQTLMQHAEQTREEKEEDDEDEGEPDNKGGDQGNDGDSSVKQQQQKQKRASSLALRKKAHIWKVDPHPWTAALCQERLPEYHTRCRSFFRHIVKYQKSKQRKEEGRNRKQDPLQRIKRLRLAAAGAGNPKNTNSKQKFQLIQAGTGEVLQSSKSPQWIPVMESLGLDDWTTHTMAFSLGSSSSTSSSSTRRGTDSSNYNSGNNGKGNNNNSHKRKQQQLINKRNRQKKSQLMQFPTMATPEGRSWLWASMLQEIEVAFGVQEITSEHSPQILDFLMHHAGLSLK